MLNNFYFIIPSNLLHNPQSINNKELAHVHYCVGKVFLMEQTDVLCISSGLNTFATYNVYRLSPLLIFCCCSS